MIDILAEIAAIHREVATRPDPGGDTVAVTLRRTYPAAVEDVWDAITTPDRLRRWFLPVTGDLREGGDFQLEGNASGRIRCCAPPSHLEVTFGDESSIVAVRLTAADEETTDLLLEHTVPIALAGSGAGALFVGPGWDGALLGLGLHLRGQAPEDPAAAANSLETQRFSAHSVRAWTETIAASGTATEEETTQAAEMSMDQFAPDPAAR